MGAGTMSSGWGRLAWVKYVLAGAGIPIAGAIIVARSQPSPEDVFDQKAAKAFGVSIGLLNEERRISANMEIKHAVSEHEWERHMDFYREGNVAAKKMALRTLSFLGKSNPRPDESVALARSFMASHKVDDWRPAIALLKSLDDPGWKSALETGLQDPDVVVRTNFATFQAQLAQRISPRSSNGNAP